jgi:flagellar M-ring protein FliF
MATASASTLSQSGTFVPGSTGTSLAASNLGGLSNVNGQDPGVSNYGGLVTQPSGPMGSLQQMMNQPAVKKSLPFMVIAMALLIFALIYNVVNAPSYRPIMAGMSESDQQAAFEALKGAEYKPVIDAGSGNLTVPTNRYHEARLFLASKGLPKAGPAGLDSLKEQSSLTTSQFMEQVRYTSAMEQELARTIMQIDSIQTARVHLAMTKPSAFVRDRTPPKASVVVTPRSGRSVTPTQVQALVHLVASSIPLLNPENVVVVDNFGKLITDAAGDAAMGMTAGQTKHKQNMEDLYRQRVLQILSPVVGDANVRSQVNLTLDFSQTETTTEDFDAANKGPKTRSEVMSEDKNSAKEASGIPGTLSNTAPPAPTTTLNTNTTASKTSDERSTTAMRSTKNYEMDRSVKHTKGATGGIQKLSVAVVINERSPTPQPKNDKGEAVEPKANPYTPEEIERMQSLVRGVVGFDEDRNDVVTVVQAKFEPEAVYDLSVPWYKDESITSGIKSGLLGLVFVAFLMMVVRPVVNHMMNRDKEAAQAAATSIQMAAAEAVAGEATAAALEAGAAALEEGETLEQMKAKMKPKKSNISMEMLDTANTYDDKVALVRMIVAEDSARVANVLKNMIKPA